jgi:predicted DNA-binding transcriptional regulator AlpA
MRQVNSAVHVLSRREAGKRVGVHPATITRWSTEERFQHLGFPALVRLGDGRVGILEHELNAWLLSRPRVAQHAHEAA